MITENEIKAPSGIPMIFVLLLAQITTLFLTILALKNSAFLFVFMGILANIGIGICWAGFFMVNPKEGRVMQFFGKYAGTVHDTGLRWANPFYTKMRVSLRVRNFESSKLKVNDKNGNPIEIAAVIVWEVFDTAEAVFQVDDYEDFVSIQSESALRNLATTYAYENHEDETTITLRSDPTEISSALQVEVQNRLEKAGVKVVETRISHLAYSPEIANAMLRRQQAMAIISARQKVVEGAVGMVEMALTKLSERNIVELDSERKAAMVSNLLVVLCSDEAAQPVVNTGSLY